jgi:hypothetical protein
MDTNTEKTAPWGDEGPTDRLLAKRRHSHVGASVAAWGDAIEQVEALYAESSGEVTDETMAAEAWAEMAEKDAAEALARFERFCVLTLDAVKAEQARLDEARERMTKRLEWARAEMLRILGERKSLAVGPYRITSRKSASVVADDDLDLVSLAATHPDCVRWTEPKPAEPKLDKAACKVALTDGLPPSGVRLVESRKVTVK